MSCVFEAGLVRQSPEKKRDTDLQSACERSNEIRESGRVFLAIKESPKVVGPTKSWHANMGRSIKSQEAEKRGDEISKLSK